MKLKKGDKVMIISGKDSGKQGTIEKTLPKFNKIVVSGINMSKRHLKPSKKNPHGGIVDKLAPIESSNAVLICPRCSKLSKVGYKIVSEKENQKTKKIRICKKCKESLE